MFLNQARGSSLIEVLVAVLMLAVGLLGFASLQTQALRLNYESLQRSIASSMAEDIIDRVRANIDDADNYQRDFGDDKPTVAVDCYVASCTSSQMAAWDLKNWMTRLQTRAPNSDAQITLNNRLLTVEISLVEQSESRLAILTAQKAVDNAATPEAKLAAQEALDAIDIETAETIQFEFSTVL